ncbi:Calcium-dependent protein kinase [Zostera marina]|uniref:non-specific serine/threonine protein kinase n=1 Tax=Zostera marina TaxID=29655 RepID=A0A0K9PDT3_ZOSMR|nr:Calcium-dependent protein kinase [Zostera marina]
MPGSKLVIPHDTPDIHELYTLTSGKNLGEGQFGTTYLCTEKSSGVKYACKSIDKVKLICREDYEDVWREIQIMHHLSEHPEVVEIRGAYEDDKCVYIVMELCGGGELFDRIIKKGHYSEKAAARIFKVVVKMVQACHSLGVMHRDLKPENFLFLSKDDDSVLKATDFGLSIFYRPGEIYSEVVGSPYYVAPEVLLKSYGPEIDVWSAGIILYILLSGVPPFWAENEAGIFKEILKGPLDLESEPWPEVSQSAKDLIKKMLERNPKKRYTVHDVLCHPWILDDNVAPDRPMDSAVLSRLHHFSQMNRLKKMALRFIIEKLSEEEIGGLKELFKMIDGDNNGIITFKELKQSLQKDAISQLTEIQIQSLMDAADTNSNGTIEYSEFIAATLHMNKVLKEENLKSAFSFFDKDETGYITINQLKKAGHHFGLNDGHLDDMNIELNQNYNGRIDYNEFAAMMKNGNEAQ